MHIPVGHSPCLRIQIMDQCKASYVLFLNIQELIYEQLTKASKQVRAHAHTQIRRNGLKILSS